MDNLPELRDIHLPEYDVSIFPLAWGWWGLLCFFAGIWLLIKIMQTIRRSSAKLYAKRLMAQWQNVNDLRAAVKISELLRRICLQKYPAAACLSDNDWVTFLNQKASYKLDEKAADLLKNAPFMPDKNKFADTETLAKLKRFCQTWIGENL